MGKKKQTYQKKRSMGVRIFVVCIAAAMLIGILIMPLKTSALVADTDEGSVTVSSFETGKLDEALRDAANGVDYNNLFNIAVLKGTLNTADYSAILAIPNVTYLELAGCDTENGVIPEYALASRNQLSYVSLPKNTVEIAKGAFGSNKKLAKVSMPNTVTKIGDNAFESCEALSDIAVSDKITYIGEGAFKDCKAIESFVIPAAVTEIYPYTFSKCGFSEIHFGADVSKIADGAFSDCYNLKDIYFYGENPPAISGQGVFQNVSASVHVKAEYEENFTSLEGNNIHVYGDLDGDIVYTPADFVNPDEEMYENTEAEAVQADVVITEAEQTAAPAADDEITTTITQYEEPINETGDIRGIIAIAVISVVVLVAAAVFITVKIMKKKMNK